MKRPQMNYALAALLVAAALIPASVRAQADAPKPNVSDSFSLTPEKKAGSALAGTRTETGDETWAAIGKFIYRPDGGITFAESGHGGTALVGIPGYSGTKPVRISADINPTGSGHTALAFLSTGSPGDFWKTVGLFIAFTPSGRLDVFSDKVTNKIFTADATAYDFKRGDYNHVELTYDPNAATVTVSANGKELAKNVAVVTPPTISHAAIQFNEQMKENEPAVKNFSVTVLP